MADPADSYPVSNPASPTVAFPARIDAELSAFLGERIGLLSEISADLGVLAQAARDVVLAGGKRMRPTFVYWGWRCVQPEAAPGESELIRAAAGLELLHASALVHDDVMDNSQTRRSRPTAHVRFSEFHRRQDWPGSELPFGAAAAVLLGDLLLVWSEELFTGAIGRLPGDRARAATAEFDRMRTEVIAGQFLDMLAQARGAFDPDEALRVIEFKTSKYTVQRPLLLGALAAGGSAEQIRTLATFGVLYGEAFQLRDDWLGVFGDSSRTGKSTDDDLREGKRTLLVALAFQAADPDQRAVLQAGLGDPALTADGVARLREVLQQTGARAQVEQRILDRATEAARCLAGGSLQPGAARELLQLAQAAPHRTF